MPRVFKLSRPRAAFMVWAVAGVCLAGLVLSFNQWAAGRDHALWRAQSQAQMANLAVSYAKQVEAKLEQIDQLTIFLHMMHAEGGSGASFQQAFDRLPQSVNFNASVVDAHGEVKYSRYRDLIGLSLAETEAFTLQAARTDAGLLISPAEHWFGRLDRQPFVSLSRRLQTPKGEFDGLVVVSINPADLTSFYLGDSGQHASHIAIVDTADRLIARAEWQLGGGESPANPVPLTVLLEASRRHQTSDSGWLSSRQPLTQYPVDVVVALPEARALAAFSGLEQARTQIARLGALVFLIGGLGIGAWSYQRALRVRQLEKVRESFRVAVDGATDNLLTMVTFQDASTQTIGFRIDDCNLQAAQTFGRTQQEMLGKSMGDLLPIDSAEAAHAILLQASQQGMAEQEVALATRGEQAQWYFCRVVRTEAGLALTLRDITDLKQREQQLQQLALNDALTQLPNRHWVNQALPGLLAQATSQQPLAAMFIDLDNFKNINDTLGHQVGDEFLVAVAKSLRESVRRGDHVVRLGGDEFMVIAKDIGDVDAALTMAQSVLVRLRDVAHLDRWRALQPRASIGVAMFPFDAADAGELVQASDIAMYEAKRTGKDRVCRFNASLRDAVNHKVALENALRLAVSNQELLMYLQPRAYARSGQLSGFEALLRWQHPSLGLLEPQRFIRLAEESDLIGEIGCWIAENACAELARWQRLGYPMMPISVNVSARQLRSSRFREELIDSMRRHGVPASLMGIELTETTMVGDDRNIQRELKLLSELGLTLMIDDFGTGYSSLSQLQRLNVDVLKIDKSFVRNLSSGVEGTVICQAMIQIGRTLGLQVIAEGVETQEQLAQLRLMGCDEIQGYLLAYPMPVQEAVQLLLQGESILLTTEKIEMTSS